jgi:transposase-like protein
MIQAIANSKKEVTYPQSAVHLSCPRCGAKALNKYGHLKSGKQRYLCLVCNRQFAWPNSIKPIPYRPHCPACGRGMHVYARKGDVIRFRCQDYPNCRTYFKINNGEH